MKKQKAIISFCSLIVLAIAIFSASRVSAEEKKSLREMLIASKNVNYVYAIDEYNTYVMPVIVTWGSQITPDLGIELSNYCDGKLEIDTQKVDPLTQTKSTIWVPYDGKEYLFNRTVYDSESKQSYDFSGIRCNGDFEINDMRGYWTEPSKIIVTSSFTSVFKPHSFFIHHTKKQPYVYKAADISSPDKVTMPTDGSITKKSEQSKGFFSSLGKLLGNEELYSSFDLYQYIDTLCSKSNGHMRFIVDKGKLGQAEVNALEAFKYMLIRSGTPSYTAYLVCDGPSRFTAK